MLAVLAYLMIIVFMALIMTKRSFRVRVAGRGLLDHLHDHLRNDA